MFFSYSNLFLAGIMIKGEKDEMEEFIKINWEDNCLLGVLHRTQDVYNPIVLFLHGIPGDRVDTRRLPVRIARELSKQNVSSLRIDLLASGVSRGAFENVTIHNQKNQVEYIIEYIRDDLGIKGDIILFAFSEAAKMVNAIARSNSEVSGVCYCNGILAEEHMAESLRIKRLYKKGKNIVANIGFGVWINSQIFSEIKNGCLKNINDLAQKKSLFIYGGADDLTFNSLRLVKKSSHDLKVIEGADHLFTNSVFDKIIIQEVCEWIKKEYLL